MLKLLLMSILFWVCVTSQTVSQLKGNEIIIEEFENFIIKYNRQYKNEKEKALRFSNFFKNMKKTEELNKLYKEEQFGVTKFSDWSEEEIKGMLGYKPAKNTNVKGLMPLHKFNQGPAPTAFDWRKHNAVTPVKYQGMCGSCWAFSCVGNIEGQYALKHHKLVSLSAQEIVDCATYHNGGCAGGYMDKAFEDFTTSGFLLESDSAYPYKAVQDSCNYNKQKGLALVIGYNYINSTNEDELKQAVYEYGPLTFGMNGDQLLYWTGKIFPGCPDNAGEDYWIVKNSWGADWNGDGYFNMKRGINICDIMTTNNFMTSQVA